MLQTEAPKHREMSNQQWKPLKILLYNVYIEQNGTWQIMKQNRGH